MRRPPFPKLRTSFRTRVLLPMVGCVVLLAVLEGIFLSHFLGHQARRSLERRAHAIARLLSQAIAPGIVLEDDRTIAEALELIDGLDDVAYVVVFDPEGRLVHRRGVTHHDATSLGAFLNSLRFFHQELDPGAKCIHAQTPIVLSARHLGTVAVGMSTESIDAAVAEQRRNLLVAAGSVLVIGLGAGILLTRRTLEPVAQLTAAARGLAAGDDSSRATCTSNDELGELAATFNEMADAITRSRLEIEEHNRELERRIDNRTRELKLQTKRALEASRLKSEFLANMSHEIRTPMNAILGFAGLLGKEPLTASQQESVSIIATSATNLLAIINDILDLSKIEAGRLEIDRVEYSPLEVATESLELVRAEALERGLVIKLDTAAETNEVITGDPLRVRQILQNLVGNAVKFTESGQITLGVEHANLNGQQAIRYVVTDTGIGIPAEKMETIFDAFTQADGSTTRKFGGTGLGLTITKRLTEIMGGTIELESEVEVGTTFRVTLPDAARSPTPLEPRRSGVKHAPGAGPHRPWGDAPARPRILVVDDNRMNRRLLARFLNHLGYDDVTMAVNGADCLETLEQREFDLVLLDMQMPVMNGYDTVRCMREDSRWENLPVIAVTAHAMVGDAERCLAAGCTDYLAKPFSASELGARIEHHLRAAPRSGEQRNVG